MSFQIESGPYSPQKPPFARQPFGRSPASQEMVGADGGATAPGGDPSMQARSPLHRAMLNLESQQRDFDERLKHLFGRLEPVLAPVNTTSAEDPGHTKGDCRQHCDTVEWVYGQVHRYAAYSSMLDEILSRLEV